jgi:hypothetical protein
MDDKPASEMLHLRGGMSLVGVHFFLLVAFPSLEAFSSQKFSLHRQLFFNQAQSHAFPRDGKTKNASNVSTKKTALQSEIFVSPSASVTGPARSAETGAGTGLDAPLKLLLTSTSRCCCCAGPTKLDTPAKSAAAATTTTNTASTEVRERTMFVLSTSLGLKKVSQNDSAWKKHASATYCRENEHFCAFLFGRES